MTAPLREALANWLDGFAHGAGIELDTAYLADNLAETLEADYVIEGRPADPGPACLNHYAGDMVCGQPAGHVIDTARPDTWHRYGTVRWC